MPGQDKDQLAPFERTLFLWGMTFLGGYLNAYSLVARGGFFVTFHTGNMTRLGVSVALQDWTAALGYIIPICACLLGACFSEWFRRIVRHMDWRQAGLALELISLLAIGFLPGSVPNRIINTYLSFLAGFQLCIFRAWEGRVHNTTICTGNIRNLGMLFYGAITGQEGGGAKFLRYGILVFSFPLGACLGTLATSLLGIRGVWPCCLILIIWISWFRGSIRQK